MTKLPNLARRAVLALLTAAALPLGAAPLPPAIPETVGLSTTRLAQIDATVKRWIDKKEIPGSIVMVARRGRLAYVNIQGFRDSATREPLREDAIFRLYSMTKPIVSVAALSLMEEGRLSLDEPVSKYIPEFKSMSVGSETFDPKTGTQSFQTVPAKRQITVQDLLRHTSGLTYGPPLSTRTHIHRMYKEAGIWSQDWLLADFAKALAKMPLVAEPGTTWEYSHSTDILGRVVEVAAGKTLDLVVQERVLNPLGMTDTHFSLPSDKHARIAQPQPDPYTGVTPDLLDFTKPQTFFAGGHGLAGTAGDYMRFVQMLVNGGSLEGARVLGPRTVEFASSNHLHPGIDRGTGYLPGPGYGFGLGFAVRTDRGMSTWNGSTGDYYWGGYGGTAFWVDPKEQLVVVFMTTEPTRRMQYRMALRSLVYQSIIE